MRVQLREYTKEYLNLSWKWLNDNEIQKLTNTLPFTRKQQKEWFNSLNKFDDYFIWGIACEYKSIGACGLKKITNKDCEYWGYIGEKEYWGRGLGSDILALMINKAKELGLESVWLQVIKSNERAIKLYFKHGFSIESEKGSLIFMRKTL